MVSGHSRVSLQELCHLGAQNGSLRTQERARGHQQRCQSSSKQITAFEDHGSQASLLLLFRRQLQVKYSRSEVQAAKGERSKSEHKEISGERERRQLWQLEPEQQLLQLVWWRG